VEAGGDDEPRRAARDERAVLGWKDRRGEGVAGLLGHLVHGHLVDAGLRRWPVAGLGENAGPGDGLGSVRGFRMTPAEEPVGAARLLGSGAQLRAQPWVWATLGLAGGGSGELASGDGRPGGRLGWGCRA
jgi:hypothetical protein